MSCGCEEVEDAESWHRHRGIPICQAGRESRNARNRARYERRAALAGRAVRPRGARSWVPGSVIVLDEVDPL